MSFLVSNIDFGDLKQNDWIAFLEQTTHDMVDWGIDLKSSLDRLAPRAVGSRKVSAEQELADYRNIRADPDPTAALAMWVVQKASQHGEAVARQMAVEFVERNEKKLNGI